MWKVLPLALLALPGLASAADNCKFQAARNLTLDLDGVRTVVIQTGSHDFHLKAGSPGVEGRACASSQKLLDALRLVQRRDGDRLVISPEDNQDRSFGFGSHYAHLDVDVSLPATLPVEVAVGSGDADVTGLADVSAHVGSGDLDVRDAGRLDAEVGSGDMKANGIGRLELGAVGSGDVEAGNIRGDVRIGTIGSGDVDLSRVGGSVEARSIGSGDLSVATVSGDLRVRHVGSGDVDHSGVKGHVDIPDDQ
jgi:hypothetical protein